MPVDMCMHVCTRLKKSSAKAVVCASSMQNAYLRSCVRGVTKRGVASFGLDSAHAAPRRAMTLRVPPIPCEYPTVYVHKRRVCRSGTSWRGMTQRRGAAWHTCSMERVRMCAHTCAYACVCACMHMCVHADGHASGCVHGEVVDHSKHHGKAKTSETLCKTCA